jgi:glycosyltransferase involved in cell wall biosynthesis
MKLGFYYHLSLRSEDGKLYLPGCLAVFVNSLAIEVDELILFMHEASGSEMKAADYPLNQRNIQWVNLGKKTPAWHRCLFYRSILKPLKSKILQLDILLIRSPSPLAPYFKNMNGLANKITYLVVGDYGAAAKNMKISSLRDRLVRAYLNWNNRQFKKVLCGQKILVNSAQLYDNLKNVSGAIFLVTTTTLSELDFYDRCDTCQSNPVKLLFTGRIDFAKGLKEFVEAGITLWKNGIDLELHFVGCEWFPGKSVENTLIEMAKGHGFENKMKFHGFKKVGPDLNEMYRMADIYVIPSYHEGFPRTIWEAMANSLPVVATKVGSIPYFLEDKKHAILINPKKTSDIVKAVNQLISDNNLRKLLIRNGIEISKTNTLEQQTKKMVDRIKSLAKESI